MQAGSRRPPARLSTHCLALTMTVAAAFALGCARTGEDADGESPSPSSPAVSPATTGWQPPGSPQATPGAVPVVVPLSLPERQALADMIATRGPSTPVVLALVDGAGHIEERTVAADQVEDVADQLAAAGTTVAVSGAALAVDEAPAAADPQLLFAGKQVFGLEAWSAAHPEADGRGVRIAVVDDGVALRRPGLTTTSLGTPKIAAVINTASSWLLPLHPAGHTCRREGTTTALSLEWTFDPEAGLPDVQTATLRVPFDLSPCGISPYLRERGGCEVWNDYFPGASSRLVGGVLTVAALYLEYAAAGGESTTAVTQRRVLVDVDGDGRITAREVLTPISDGGGRQLVFADGVVLGFDVHPTSALVAAEPGRLGNDVDVCPEPAAQTLTVAVPQLGASHGEGVASIAAGHQIAGRGFDGMAPGAQIVDVQFNGTGNTHPYTFAEIARALQTAGRNADIVNLSYSLYFSSPAAQLGMRRVLEAALGPTAALYFFSAGNNGPGRSSMNRALLYPSFGVAVAAYLDPLLSQTTFGGALPLGGVVSYSSRGPGYDGASGALLLSPLAGIVASTPSAGFAAFSGTSSATPALAGFSARVLSQIRAENLRFSRDLFRRALIDGATPLDDVPWIDQGHGIPRLQAVMERYRALVSAPKPPPAFDVTSSHARDGVAQQGIHVRGHEGRLAQYTFRLGPVFSSAWTGDDRSRYSAELAIESTVDWLRAPPAALVGRAAVSLDVSVDWAQLDATGGGEHLGEVRIFEVEREGDRGVVGRRLRAVIPATVLLPASSSAERGLDEEIALPADGMIRRFLPRPPWASHLVVSSEVADAQQSHCGRFIVYDPDGSEGDLTGISGPFRQESAHATSVPGLYELVLVADRNHKGCAQDQRLRIKARWLSLALVRQAARPGPAMGLPTTSVEVLVSTGAPLQMGAITLGSLGDSFRVDLLPSSKSWEWSSDRTLDLQRFGSFGFRIDPVWRTERAMIPSIMMPFVQLVSANTGPRPVRFQLPPTGDLGPMLSPTVLPPGDAGAVGLRLTMFDAGSEAASQPGRIPLIGHGTLGPSLVASSRAQNVQLTRLDPRTVTFSFNAALADLRGKTALCTFQPLDFQVSVPCGTLEIW